MPPVFTHMKIVHATAVDPDPQGMREFVPHHIEQSQRGAGKKPEQADQAADCETADLLAQQKSAMSRAFQKGSVK